MDTDRNIQTTAGQKSRSTGTVDQPFAPDSILPTHEPPKAGTRYRVTKLHRSGGLGRVWVARDEALGRDVALKDLHPERAADSRLRNRFVEEARITGQLEHPYIVPLYDLIDGPNGPCYTMRFAAGKTLAEAAREYHARRIEGKATALDLAGLLDAFVAVCRAVAYAHSRNVLHRDLKGQNVVLGEYGEVFVLDWGLAKIAPGKAATAPAGSSEASPAVVTPSPVGPRDETMSGSILGTPAFLAPEQVGGCPASTATDVYGLGAMLYVILTGNPPYDGPTMQDVLEHVSAGPPRPPRTVNADCPVALEAICRKAMAREAANRYPNAEALSADVRRWQADEPVEAYREPWSRRVARWARRHRAAVLGGIAVLVTGVIGLVVNNVMVRHEERRTAGERDRAQAEWKRAEESLAVSQGLAFRLLDTADHNLALVPQSGSARIVMIAAALDTYRWALSQRPGDPEVREKLALAYRYAANFYRQSDQNDKATSSYAESIRILEPLVSENPATGLFQERLAEVLRDQAQVFAKVGRLKEAIAGERRGDEISERLIENDPSNPVPKKILATGLIDLSGYQYTLAQFKTSEASARRATDIFRKVIDDSPQQQPMDLLRLGMAFHRQAMALAELDRPEDALAANAEGLKRLDEMTVNRVEAAHFRGRILVERAKMLLKSSDKQKRAGADGDLTKAIQKWDELQKDFPQRAMYREWQTAAYETRARLYLALGRPDDAVKNLEKGWLLMEQQIVKTPQVTAYRSLLGQVCRTYAEAERARGREPQAVQWLTKARDAFRAVVNQSPDDELDGRRLSDVEAALRGRGS